MSKPVSVIGLGLMGSALAKCLIDNGYDVTVWNRTASKAEPLRELGAKVADSAASAVAASDLIITNTATHKTTIELLEPIRGQLSGKTVCELSTGEAEDAEVLVAMLKSSGANYMIGIINAYPSGVGKAETALLCVAEGPVWSAHSDAIITLGGVSACIGTEPGALAAMFAALFTTRQAVMFGMIYGALVCRKTGVPLQSFVDQLPVTLEMAQNYYKLFAATVPSGDFDNAEATMAVYKAALEDTLNTFKAAGAPADLPQLFFDKTANAARDGLADKQLTALTQYLLKE